MVRIECVPMQGNSKSSHPSRPNAAASLPKHAANQRPSLARPETSYRLILVEWEDSARPIPAWQWADEYQVPETVTCISVGYLIAETDGALAVAPNLGDLGRERVQASGIIRIPRTSVRSITNL